ncbi:hypothetical protein [Thermus sp.]|uniref:hypothetical protein n=1 Tax=Thermus sp. TaxID=275 RepID=UPI0025FAE652|nr:hypothetical protein [Thermus sp.]MCS6868509.1 hypothetical protein [Thermus sp.]
MRYLPALAALALLLGGCPHPAPHSFFLLYYPAGVCPSGVAAEVFVEVGRETAPESYFAEYLATNPIFIPGQRLGPNRVRFTVDRPALSPRLEEALDPRAPLLGRMDGYYRITFFPLSRSPDGLSSVRVLFTFRCGEKPPVQVRAEPPEDVLIVAEDSSQESGLRVVRREL